MSKEWFNLETIEHFRNEAKYLAYPQIKEQVEFFVETDCETYGVEDELELVRELLNEIYG